MQPDIQTEKITGYNFCTLSKFFYKKGLAAIENPNLDCCTHWASFIFFHLEEGPQGACHHQDDADRGHCTTVAGICITAIQLARRPTHFLAILK